MTKTVPKYKGYNKIAIKAFALYKFEGCVSGCTISYSKTYHNFFYRHHVSEFAQKVKLDQYQMPPEFICYARVILALIKFVLLNWNCLMGGGGDRVGQQT
jgi:hypothetical protein